MSKLAKALTAAAGNAGESLYVEDVFSTYLYTGTGATQTITNGIDLAGEGGMVWLKERTGLYTDGHWWEDTLRGVNKVIKSNTTGAQLTINNSVTAFNSDGFSIGANASFSSTQMASWTFRKAEKFFDVVTYTGDGSTSHAISHNLGATPACIIIKPIDTASFNDWRVWHKDLSTQQYQLKLNTTDAEQLVGNFISQNDATFTVGYTAANQSGINYVAYLFASDAGGFGDDGSESIIKCGSYTGNGGSLQDVNVGFEPQYLLIKNASAAADWWIVDAMRGFTVAGVNGAGLYANRADAETTQSLWNVNATGFTVGAFNNVQGNASGNTYIYIAIRRPMKTPESGTEVFAPFAETTAAPTTLNTNFDVDLLWWRNNRTVSGRYFYSNDRLRGNYKQLRLHDTVAEQSQADPYVVAFDHSDKIVENLAGSGQPAIYYAFKRATGFFDVVAYTGTGSNTTQSHNLGVAPEMIIVKRRSSVEDWLVYHSATGNQAGTGLNQTNATFTGVPQYWNSTSPTDSVFSLGTHGRVNTSAETYIAYLFATLAGVSKVGSYTGTGADLNVDCGFSAGARFILIKRTDSTGDWYVWDSARGIVAGNDPYLLLNSTAAEVTSTDYIDPLSSGFTVTSTAPAALNASGGSYIFLAIA